MCPVLVLTGDGELLMGMGSLATVGLQKPGNLTIVVLANERYGETGGQVSHTTGTVDFVRGVALRPRAAFPPRPRCMIFLCQFSMLNSVPGSHWSRSTRPIWSAYWPIATVLSW
jgi:hypothetical protein